MPTSPYVVAKRGEIYSPAVKHCAAHPPTPARCGKRCEIQGGDQEMAVMVS